MIHLIEAGNDSPNKAGNDSPNKAGNATDLNISLPMKDELLR